MLSPSIDRAAAGAAPRASAWSLLGKLSRRAKLLFALAVACALATRIAVFGAAVAIANGDAALGARVAIVAAVAALGQRLARSGARAVVLSDVYRVTARALLDGDPLDVAGTDLQRAVFGGAHYAGDLVTMALPSLAADAISAVVLTPRVLVMFPPRAVAVAVVALAAVAVAAFALRRVTNRLHERVRLAFDRVADAMLVAIEGRLEVVARAGEDDVTQALDRRLAEYGRVARGSAIATVVVGRAPLAIGFGAAVAAVALDAAAREALTATVLSDALVLAAFAPVLLGTVLGAQAVTRLASDVAPLLSVLYAPPRPDVARAGLAAPVLPAKFDVENVTFRYSADGERVFRGLTFDWTPGEILLLGGPNGTGKTTLLRLLIGIRAPESGVIRVGGVNLDAVDARSLRKRVAFLPQRPYLGEPYTSVRDALRMGAPGADDASMNEALARVDLGGISLDRALGRLSMGQRQRVALARILLRDAKLVVLDEPDANLDASGIALVARLAEELSRAGAMVAVAAHTPELAALPGRKVTLGGGATSALMER